ncbi:MAG: hydrogenase maturation protease [Archaeoglobaceae archaeon]|nr:hydrogenase maturation protease [Archaeoglobaceae archaeon]
MKKPLILFLGNQIFRDDRIGLVVGEKLKDILLKEGYEVEIVDKTGLNLIDLLEGRDEVIVVDSIKTSKHSIGEVIDVDVENFDRCSVWSPHYIGIPETLKIMRILDLNPPKKFHIIGIEVSDIYTISEELSNEIREKVNEIVEKVYRKLEEILKNKDL